MFTFANHACEYDLMCMLHETYGQLTQRFTCQLLSSQGKTTSLWGMRNVILTRTKHGNKTAHCLKFNGRCCNLNMADHPVVFVVFECHHQFGPGDPYCRMICSFVIKRSKSAYKVQMCFGLCCVERCRGLGVKQFKLG